MILKQECYDDANRVVTTWTPEIAKACRRFSDDFDMDVLDLVFNDGTSETVCLHDNVGRYLCNDEGKTIDILSRFNKSK